MSRSYRSLYGSCIYEKYTGRRLFLRRRGFQKWSLSNTEVYILPNRQNGKKSKRQDIRICRRADKKRSRQHYIDDIGCNQLNLWFRRTIIHKG